MSIVLFAIIGATIHAGAAYWVCFGVYTVCRVLTICTKFMDINDVEE